MNTGSNAVCYVSMPMITAAERTTAAMNVVWQSMDELGRVIDQNPATRGTKNFTHMESPYSTPKAIRAERKRQRQAKKRNRGK